MKVLSFSLLGLLLLTACTESAETLVETEETQTEAEEEATVSELEMIHMNWLSNIYKGDYYPTDDEAAEYSEFLEKMRAVSDDLDAYVQENEVSEDMEDLVRRLHASLMRGDAELAPTYNEARASAEELYSEFEELIRSEGLL